MSKQERVLKWLSDHPDALDQVVRSQCDHEFETLKVNHRYSRPVNGYGFLTTPSTVEATIKFCQKCGKRVEL